MALPEIQRAVRHMRKGETDAAIAPLERVTQRMPEYVTAYVLLARMYEASERGDDALQAWRRAYFLMPNSPVVREGLYRVLQRRHTGDNPATTSNGPAASGALDAMSSFDLGQDRAAVEEATPVRRAADDRQPGASDEDLDQLIEELESARIVPRPDLEDIPPPDLEDDIDDMVSETLARIYVSQEQYGEAARVYEKLAVQQPESAERFEQKAAEMRERAGQ